MSESSSELGSGGRRRTIEQLVDRLRSRTSTDRLALTAHLSVGRTLCKLRDAIAAGEQVSKKAAMGLVCCGIGMYRRHTLGDREEEDEDTEETSALIKQSSVLIFVLLSAIEARNNVREPMDVSNAEDVVKRAKGATLAKVMRIPNPKKRKRRRDGDGEDGEDGEAGATQAEIDAEREERAEAWELANTVSSGDLTMSVLKYVAHSLGRRGPSGDHETLASLFFRNSAACMANNLLLKEGAGDFVSLRATAGNAVPREKRLLALAQAGESEAGQSVLRDLLLSFLLPSSIVGVRRTLLMSRAASTAAGVEHADQVNQAHSCAMAGTEFIWQHGNDPLERACAILAGVAVLVTKGGEDPMRKQDAFLGRLSLPFFETTPPNPGVKRLTLVPDQRRWILYRVGKLNTPTVLCNLRGFDGFCDALLEFVG
jgi:hypothetical protein